MTPEPISLFSRFKKHYRHYLLGVIIPALVNGASIPVFKNLLGAADYGKYALYFNALLIANLLVSGWLYQSVLRFYAKAADKNLFTRQVFFLSLSAGIIAFLPAAIIIWQDVHDIAISILFAFVLLLAAIQLPLQALTQSGFHSKSVVLAEAMRTVSWFSISLVLLKLGLPFLPALFTGLGISYLLSILFLCRQNALLSFSVFKQVAGVSSILAILSRYGWPFSLWFIFYNFSSYIDKLLVLQHFGPVVQGHYSALFEFLSKSLGLVLAPVIIAVMPLLTEAHENFRYGEVKTLLRKLVRWEVVALALLALLYLLFGYKLLFYILHIPVNSIFIHAGLLTITGAMVWQIALLVHKPIELNLKSGALLAKMGIAIAVQLLFYYIPLFTGSLLKYPAGYCFGALAYLLLVSLGNKKCLETLSNAPAGRLDREGNVLYGKTGK